MLHIDIPTLSDFKALAAVRGDICVSIYLPTSPQARDARANRIAFKDAAKNALAQLAEARADKRRLESLEGRLNHLAGADETNVQDQDHIRKLQHKKPKEFDVYWKQPAHGLGVLATPDNLRAFRLPIISEAARRRSRPLPSDAARARDDLAEQSVRAGAG